MGKNSIVKAQNRGKRRRLSTGNVDNIYDGIESLRVSMGIENEPEYAPGESNADEFGIVEFFAGIGIVAFAGLVNVSL